ncbi:MAG: hypothetical protein V9E98_06355 [Candidatus Nanopelagicales bacterium]
MNVEFKSFTDARKGLKDALDVASEGGVATISRSHSGRAAVVDAQQLRRTLATLLDLNPQLVADGPAEWAMFLPGYPISGTGATPEEAVTDTVDALREYADDWQERLQQAPNHRDNWGLVQLVSLSSSDELERWLNGSA